MTHQYTKLADELDAVNDVCGSRSIREAARILRAAAGADVAGLMDAADRYALAQADPAHWRSALESALRLALVAREDKPDALSGCQCQTCRPFSPMDPKSIRMILCAICGNKRCPHATDHRNACTNSNEPGQPGSSYAAAPKGTP